MDYKLMRRVILLCSLSVLVILGLVFYANDRTGGWQQSFDGSTPAVAETTTGAERTEQNIALDGDTRAFLRDDTFWDEEEGGSVLKDQANAVRLSLVATSVEKDLRIQIVNSAGERVTGEPFYVTLEDVGEYKDLDQDGIIYIGGLTAGDYYVSVNSLEGYHVSTTNLKVHVYDQVNYQTIDDIALLIKNEDEVDISSDSVSEHNLSGDVDETERSSVYTDLDTAVMGIDVSSYNGDIDWEAVAADGISFAILRCGFRGYSSGSLVEDACFLQNIEAANKAGVKVGIYFFTQATTEVEAVEEASMVITLCRDHQVDLPIFIDTESTGGSGRADGLDAENRTAVCRAFCETIENAGYRAGIYASKNWIGNKLNGSQLSRYMTWLAEYKAEATYEADYQFWQYTSNGWVDGVTGRVDLNIGNLSYANLNTGADATADVSEDKDKEE